MAKEHISLDGKRARLVSRGQTLAERGAAEVSEFFFVYTAFDTELYLLGFSADVWVVPDMTHGIATLLRAWKDELGRAACFDAYCTELPQPWCKRILCLRPPVPRLGEFPRSTLPLWTRKEPVDFASSGYPKAEPGEQT
jgi:hypothetical protein